MKILYDGQIFTLQPVGGANRYFTNVISGLPEDFEAALTTCSVREVNFPSHPSLKVFSFPRFGFRPGRLSYWCEKLYFKGVAEWYSPTLIHQTYYTTLIQEPVTRHRGRKLVVTVYDMLQEIFPNDIDPKGTDRRAKKQAVENADLVICISHNTKKDLIEYYRVSESKIRVIPLASNNFTNTPGYSPIKSRFFLFVGTRWSYKNFYRCAAAFSKIAKQESDLALCLVGPVLTEDEKKFLHRIGIGDRVVSLGYVSDSFLASLYQQCEALIYPSLYEGFGIPLLEAMQNDAPVLASNTSSIPEVVGDAAILFDPRHEDSMQSAMEEILTVSGKREELISKGKDRVKLFSWERSVRETIEAYRAIS